MLEAMLEDGLGTPNFALDDVGWISGVHRQTTMIDNGRFNGAKAYKDSKAGDLDQISRYWIDLRDNETIVFTPILLGFVYIAL